MKSFEFAHTPLAPALFWHLLRLPKNSIIHLHLAQAYYPEVVWLASGLRKIPYVVHFHLDVEPSGRLGPLFLFYKRLFWKTILKSADKVVVCSQAQAELIRSKFDVKEENIEVVPNGVSNDFFSDKIYSLPNEKFRLLFVGRLTVQKRVDRLIEAMAKISVPAELTIVGDGEQRADLEALTDRLRLKNVFFEGNKNDSEMQEYHRNHDALLISSDKEGGTVLVALEAMASGLPIIGTNVIGVREMLSDVGILIKEPFVENFSSAIESLWKNPRRLKELSRKSRKKAGEYSWGKFSSRLETIYKKIPR
jgi:glycosyltransferase involved in cell wall biosynthesis